MSGKFYIVGVGPGDKELVTIKALKTASEADVIALTVCDPDLEEISAFEKGEKNEFQTSVLSNSAPFEVVNVNQPISQKEFLLAAIPFVKDEKILEKLYHGFSKRIIDLLKNEKNVALLVKGDPTVYANEFLIFEKIKSEGFECEIISGVPIFCSAASCAKTSLAIGDEQVRIYGDCAELDHSLYLPGTKVFLKIGKNIPRLKAASRMKKVVVVEDCGLPSEHTYENMEELPAHVSYASIAIVK
ncbi:MAG: precorrin-2 C(20)-methyltransferase [Oscillospiraceae bacterium]|nr:precorrin-2 C(20)-methyltransferase [Oscillospiraceae bacterium]